MPRSKTKSFSWIIVVGTSAGGMQALRELVRQFPADFAAPVVVVQHLSPMANGSVLVDVINQSGPLRCKLAQDGDRLERGHIFIGRPDHHLLVKKGNVRVTKGARENRSRPGGWADGTVPPSEARNRESRRQAIQQSFFRVSNPSW